MARLSRSKLLGGDTARTTVLESVRKTPVQRDVNNPQTMPPSQNNLLPQQRGVEGTGDESRELPREPPTTGPAERVADAPGHSEVSIPAPMIDEEAIIVFVRHGPRVDRADDLPLASRRATDEHFETVRRREAAVLHAEHEAAPRKAIQFEGKSIRKARRTAERESKQRVFEAELSAILSSSDYSSEEGHFTGPSGRKGKTLQIDCSDRHPKAKSLTLSALDNLRPDASSSKLLEQESEDDSSIDASLDITERSSIRIHDELGNDRRVLTKKADTFVRPGDIKRSVRKSGHTVASSAGAGGGGDPIIEGDLLGRSSDGIDVGNALCTCGPSLRCEPPNDRSDPARLPGSDDDSTEDPTEPSSVNTVDPPQVKEKKNRACRLYIVRLKREASRSNPVQPVLPTPYDGNADEEAFINFMAQCNRYIQDTSLTDRPSQHVYRISFFLTGKARKFYFLSVRRTQEHWTLTNFYKDLTEYCFDFSHLRRQLHALSQGDRSVRDFAYDLEKKRILLELVEDFVEKDVKLQFWFGVRPSIRVQMTRDRLNPISDLTSFEDLHRRAETIEKALSVMPVL